MERDNRANCHSPEARAREDAHYWLVAKPGEDTGLCFVDPKFDVDLCMVDDMRAFTSAWTGHSYFGSRSPRCPSHFPATIY